MSYFNTRRITICAMIAALYTALTLAFLLTSFGALQIRVSEALTLLPVFSPLAIVGVTLGCAVSNALGLAMGANLLGALDIVFGSAATLIAAFLTYKLRNVTLRGIPFLAPLPPVIVNALVIGLELTYLTHQRFVPESFFLFALQVGAGQLIPCYVLGMILVVWLRRTGLYKYITGEDRPMH